MGSGAHVEAQRADHATRMEDGGWRMEGEGDTVGSRALLDPCTMGLVRWP